LKRLSILLVLGLAASILAACTAGSQPAQEATPKPLSAEDQVATVLAKTAALEEAVYGTMTALAPLPTFTSTPSITPSPTITPTPSPSPSITPTIAPTDPDPNVEPWCNEHVGCERVEIKNKTSFWANVLLDNRDTDVLNHYSIPPKARTWLTIRPGYFYYMFTLCDGQVVYEGNHGLNMHWYVEFDESECTKYE